MATPFANPERQFRAKRDTSPTPIHNIYTFYESESSESESEDIGEIDIETFTLEQRFCPPAMILEQLGEIRNFKQEDEESLFHTWERYNDLLFKCPFHDLNDHQKVSTFYNGLKGQTRRIIDSNGLIPGLTTSEAFRSIQELADHSHKWQNEECKNTPSPFSIIAEKLKTLNHEMDELRVDVRKINTNDGMRSLHEDIKSIRTSEINYDKFSPKSNIYSTNLKDTFEHYLKESCKRQDNLNEWMKKFMINTEMSFKDHNSSIKRLEEIINLLVQSISTHNLTNKECTTKLKPASEKPTLKVETFAEKIEEVSMVKLNARCSTILQNELPPKEKDPGSFILPCAIGTTTLSNALADLGLSINIMPFS
ncbi:hypothetical protein Tco_0499001 [Tanacetum coccineum]